MAAPAGTTRPRNIYNPRLPFRPRCSHVHMRLGAGAPPRCGGAAAEAPPLLHTAYILYHFFQITMNFANIEFERYKENFDADILFAKARPENCLKDLRTLSGKESVRVNIDYIEFSGIFFIFPILKYIH